MPQAGVDPHVKRCMPEGQDPKDGPTARELADQSGKPMGGGSHLFSMGIRIYSSVTTYLVVRCCSPSSALILQLKENQGPGVEVVNPKTQWMVFQCTVEDLLTPRVQTNHFAISFHCFLSLEPP